MHSWRDPTKRQYWSYIQKWLHLCVEKHVNPMSPSVSVVLDYLAGHFHAGIGYSGLNTARSALSSFVTIKGHGQIGKHNLINRFMKGIFHLKPSLPRYNFTWNVSDLLKYLDKLDNHSLSLKQITLKCVSLLCLLTAQRLQSIHLVDIRNLEFSDDIVKIRIGDILKQSKPGKPLSEIVLNTFLNKNLCIVTCLKLYIKLTENLRGKENKLFISFVAPYKGVSKDTISRWIKAVMTASGIDCSKFKPHSVRSVSVSKASAKGLSLSTIMRTAGWSNQFTFRKFYQKPITVDTTLCNSLLNNVDLV